jgi:DNA-binding transcriptional ArsR family regulator
VSKPHRVRAPKQLAALVAPARQEIVDALEQLGTASVAELAATLGRPADALYFHLRALVRAGLVRGAGSRARTGGTEALYRTIAPTLQLKYEPGNRTTIAAIVASMLRLATRDFARSLARGDVVVDGPRRELHALRKVGRLSAPQLARLNRGIAALVREITASPGRGRLYAVTLTVTPLDHRTRRTR